MDAIGEHHMIQQWQQRMAGQYSDSHYNQQQLMLQQHQHSSDAHQSPSADNGFPYGSTSTDGEYE